ncbi:pyridoxamine 5'-phosphate oxidase-domain-containing protein [Chaetomium strumarium]|uniref:Pyridoxamine 5'-phosphate oxidase-domain-containing protein n=1 Tax=Chaetomium strumarium TaxID=1170767 RepID=A0AAJ0H3W7_9PEZI|nr:pyridoxamine 5'-phosphate oxidase-domain-containing protein [Chaetomium strumarium]
MKPGAITCTLVSCCTAAAGAATISASSHELSIPTSYESAVLGRRILALTPLGTISTVFPEDKHADDVTHRENRPSGLGGMPYGLMEYVADCEDNDFGNPTILAISIGTTFKNAAAGSNVSLAVQWTPPHPPAKRIESTVKQKWLSYLGWSSNDDEEEAYHKHKHHHDFALPYSAANLPRFSLIGHLEPIEGGDDRDGHEGSQLAKCFVKSHPDAKYWLPGNRIHESHFVRLVVEQIYWVGGFGDRAFIGWIPVEEWQNVTREEWQNVRLPGEKKGWKEWSVVPGDL